MAAIRLRYVKAISRPTRQAALLFPAQGLRYCVTADTRITRMAAYEAANTLPVVPVASDDRVRFLPGSLGHAIESFLASGEYTKRALKILSFKIVDCSMNCALHSVPDYSVICATVTLRSSATISGRSIPQELPMPR